jgi:hypothetical protein
LSSQHKPRRSFHIPIVGIQRYFSPAYAFTTYKAEGQTISSQYTIWEFDRMHHKTKYTALTRTTNCQNVDIKCFDEDTRQIDIVSISSSINPVHTVVYAIIDTVTLQKYIGSISEKQDVRARDLKHSMPLPAWLLKHLTGPETTKLQKHIQSSKPHNLSLIPLITVRCFNPGHLYRILSYYIKVNNSIQNGLNVVDAVS